MSEANQALKHQFAQNLRDPILEWWPRDSVCLPLTLRVSPQFWGQLALMFNSWGKQCAKANVTTSAVDSGDQEYLSCNSRQRQTKINAQAAVIATMKTELNKALQENKRFKSLFSLEKLLRP